MGVVAVRAALREAGVGKGGFQAAFCGTAYGGGAAGHQGVRRRGVTGRAIGAGKSDTVLVFGTEKMPRGIIRSSFFEPWQEEAGLAATPAFFGLRAPRLAGNLGGDKQHLAQVVVKSRH